MAQVPRSGAEGSTWLFVPGDRPERFDKAAEAGSDHVVLDLEDAVASPAKALARAAVMSWLAEGRRAWVRLNATGTPWREDDVAALGGVGGLAGVMVPKAESPADMAGLRDRLGSGTGLVALVETARGVQMASALADSGHVDRLALGSIDLALDLGAEESDDSLLLARATLVMASRAAGLPGPVDGVSTVTDDPAHLIAAATRAASLGFTGKLCIHPRQVPIVAAAFMPNDRDIAWARRVVAEAEMRGHATGAFRLDGEMVDRPVVERARTVLRRRPASGSASALTAVTERNTMNSSAATISDSQGAGGNHQREEER